MYMSEDYNSPQSVYWCLKTFSILGLPDDHPFWNCVELPHPLAAIDKSKLSPIGVVSPALQITCAYPEHHFLLSAGQSTQKPHKAREAKYSKFAYSSAFAFSVPTGPLLAQMAPDSTLSISDDGGETWKARWEPISARVQNVKLSKDIAEGSESERLVVPVLISTWKPWRGSDLKIETILIPPLERWPGWHVRIHKLTLQNYHACPSFQLVDAGFAISSQGNKGGNLPAINADLKAIDTLESRQGNEVASEGYWKGSSGCLILSGGGASGVAELSPKSAVDTREVRHKGRASILKPDANTNLMAQRTLMPTLHHYFERPEPADHDKQDDSNQVWLVSGVFAVAGSAGIDLVRVREMWRERPTLKVEEYMDLL